MTFAQGSVRLEGFVVSPEAEALTAQYVRGDITIAEGITALDKIYKHAS
ncbi:MAG: antitoxin VbhA family protein [Burkholderiales bacterium]